MKRNILQIHLRRASMTSINKEVFDLVRDLFRLKIFSLINKEKKEKHIRKKTKDSIKFYSRGFIAMILNSFLNPEFIDNLAYYHLGKDKKAKAICLRSVENILRDPFKHFNTYIDGVILEEAESPDFKPKIKAAAKDMHSKLVKSVIKPDSSKLILHYYEEKAIAKEN